MFLTAHFLLLIYRAKETVMCDVVVLDGNSPVNMAGTLPSHCPIIAPQIMLYFVLLYEYYVAVQRLSKDQLPIQ